MSFIETHALYAQSALQFKESEVLCSFLQKMDDEERGVQKLEEAAIVEETKKETRKSSLLYGALVGGTGIFFGAMIAPEAIITGLVLSILSVLAGAITAGIGMVTGCFGMARPKAMDTLRINCYRAGRLYNKVHELAEAKLRATDENEGKQLTSAKSFFKGALLNFQRGTQRNLAVSEQTQKEQKS